MPDIEIYRWSALAKAPDCDRLIADLDHVFFSSSGKQSFADAEDKAAFRERWLGRYLRHFPAFAFVARAPEGQIIGYVIGSLDDPARDPLFADLKLFVHFAEITPRYPAQLHVNLDAAWRSHGIGARLVSAFCDMARGEGVPGVHVVTQRGMRNVGFYAANGFHERGAVTIDGHELLFLGRDLTAGP